MSITDKLWGTIKAIYDEDARFKLMNRLGMCNHMTDEEYLKRKYKSIMGIELNLDNPRTFNEKLQWLKLHNRRPEYTTMVDKYEVKKFVVDRIGAEYVIPTLGVWDRFDNIDFSLLPNQFVLKTTHDSGGIVICNDKSKLDIQKARERITNSLKRNYYLSGREWPYKDVKPRIIAEKYMEDSMGSNELTDYKYFCFSGKVKMMFIATDRNKSDEETKFDFFDENFKHLPFIQGHPNSKKVLRKPKCFEKMKELAELLSSDMPHIRVDFYEVNSKIYFGELTFYHFNGMQPIIPEDWDYKIGEWLSLPKKMYD